MKNNLNIKYFTALIFALSILSLAVPSMAASNNIAFINTTNCTTSFVSTSQVTDSMNVTSTVTYRLRLNVTAINTSAGCRFSLSLYDQSTVNINSTNLTNQSGVQIVPTANWTNSSDERWEINFTVSGANGLSANTSQFLNLTFTTASNATTTANLTQRFSSQVRMSMTNNAELDLLNVYTRNITYFDWIDASILIYDCGADRNCADVLGNQTGKTRLTARIQQMNGTNSLIFADTNLTLLRTTFFGIEGDIPTGYEEEEVSVYETTGGTDFGIGGVTSVISPTRNNFFGISLPFDTAVLWFGIIVTILIAIAYLWGKK